GAGGAGRRTTILPAACPREIELTVSPVTPPKTTCALVKRRGMSRGVPAGDATKSAFHLSALPSTVSVDCSVYLRTVIGRFWKYVPLSPAGSRPSRFTSLAM